MTRRSSPGATAWSLFLAFLGSVVVVYLVEVAPAITTESRYGTLLSFVLFPLLGAVVAVPICVLITLAVWGCLVLGNRWVRTSPVWAGVVSAALVGVVCAALALLIMLVLPTLREPLQLLAYALAVVVAVAICLLRGVGRHEAASTPAPPSGSPS
ncbi:hypothetical protein [Microbacterium sp. ZW T5_56]|uniref:hypothetical protein n=1 Tax=Microbacterium sp. ZW T5_56 TaxID=3378081 RepID=UPI0038543808